MGFIYEIVDNTNDEMYYTLGIFTDLGSAIKQLEKKNPEDLDEIDSRENGWYTVEIRERKIGWSDSYETVFSCTWSESWNEELEEYQWEMTEKIGVKQL